MTPAEIDIAKALGACTFPVGHPHKRYARAMAERAENHPEGELTPKQHDYLMALAYRYRRQMPKWIELAPEVAKHDPQRAAS